MFNAGADRHVIYSASDLAAAARCEYALLRSFDAQLGRGPAVSSDDELLARTAQLGDEHEQRHLDELRAAADDNVAVIGRPAYTVAGPDRSGRGHPRRRRAPRARHLPGRDVRRPVRRLRRLPGPRDPSGDRYRLRDTKLARSVKVEALLQLAAYADTLATRRRAGGRRGRAGARRRRGGELPGRRTAAGLPAAAGRAAAAARRPPRRRRRRCRGRTPGCARASAAPSAPSRSARTTTCCWWRACGSANAPGCIDAGVEHPCTQLAAHAGPVPELSARTVNALTAQARLQVADRAWTASRPTRWSTPSR